MVAWSRGQKLAELASGLIETRGSILAQPKSHRYRLLIPALLAGLLLAAVLASTVMVSENRAAGTRMLAAQNIPVELSRLMILLQRAESSQRGYLLTGDYDHLVLYRDSVDRLTPGLWTFSQSVQHDPELQGQLALLLPVFNAKVAELGEAITLFESGRRDEAMALVRSSAGKRHMDDIRESVARIWTEAQQQSQGWIGQWRRNSGWLLAVQIAASLLVLVVGAVFILNGIRHMRMLEGARGELEAANEGLEEKVRERTADLQEANEEIQKFAYIISHDLRSPLVNIMGFTAELDELRREIRDPGTQSGDSPTRRDPAAIDVEFNEALDFIRRSTKKMDRLIAAVLDLARSGQREFRYIRIDMNRLMADIAGTFQHRLGESGAELTIEILPDITCDRLALEQIFGNILDNAIKYLDDARPGLISVRGRREGQWVTIDVEDNGRGIEAHDVGRIFDLFRRGGKQDRPGDGIGLAHLRVLIRRLGGKISCRSEPDRGSTFTVRLPRHGRAAG